MTNREVVKAFYDALAEGDLEKFTAIQQPDAEYNISGHTVLSGHYKGIDRLMEILPRVFGALNFEEFKFSRKWKIMCEQEDFIVCIMEADGFAKNGSRYDQRYVQMFGFRDGKISRLIEFFDTALANEALSLIGQAPCDNDGEFKF